MRIVVDVGLVLEEPPSLLERADDSPVRLEDVLPRPGGDLVGEPAALIDGEDDWDPSLLARGNPG